MNHTAPPYRTPCGGWAKPAGHSCYQHWRRAETAIEAYHNTTIAGGVPPTDGCNALGPDSGSPGTLNTNDNNYYARPDRGTASGAQTDAAGYAVGTGPAVPINLPIAAAGPPAVLQGTGSLAAGDTIMFSGDPNRYTVTTPVNNVALGPGGSTGGMLYFTPGLMVAMDATQHTITVMNPTTWNKAMCHKRGWKAVRADKAWHGKLPFTQGCANDCANPPTVKYLVCKHSLTGTYTPNDGSGRTYTMNWVREYTVDRYSGRVTRTQCDDGWELTTGVEDPEQWEPFTMPPIAPQVIQTGCVCGTDDDDALNGFSTTAWAGSGLNVAFGSEAIDVRGDHFKVASGSIADTVFEVNLTQLDGAIPALSLLYKGELSAPYTLAECYADAVALLNYWDLTDDKVHEWRTDDVCGLVPVICRREAGYINGLAGNCDPELFMEAWGVCGTEFSDGMVGDGTIRGKPNTAGYGWPYPSSAQRGSFAWEMPVGPTSTGQWTPAQLPATATWWTLPSEYGTYPFGAYIQLGDTIGGNTIHVQKWAGIKESFPSMNFFRPCGEDRVKMDETAVFCVDPDLGISGATVNLLTNPGLTAGDLVGVAGGGIPADGVYRVASNTGTVVVLESSGGVPTLIQAYSHYVNTGDHGILAPIRWPNAWAICGRSEVTAVELTDSDTKLKFTVGTAVPWLRVGDVVDFVTYGASPTYTETVALGSKTVTDIVSGTEFKVASTTLPTITGWYVKSHGAPHYKWDDDDAKGDFTVQQWTIDMQCGADTVFTCCQSATCCIKRNPCFPSVACFSPNSEAFPNGITYPMTCPDSVNLWWQGIAVLAIPDPLWQHPHPPCGTATDDCAGSTPPIECLTPYVEPRCVLPDGAPTTDGSAPYIHLDSTGIYLPCPGITPAGSCSPPQPQPSGICSEPDEWFD